MLLKRGKTEKTKTQCKGLQEQQLASRAGSYAPHLPAQANYYYHTHTYMLYTLYYVGLITYIYTYTHTHYTYYHEELPRF